MRRAEGVAVPISDFYGPLLSVHTPARLFGPRAALRLRQVRDAQPTSPHPLLLHSAIAHKDGVQVQLDTSQSHAPASTSLLPRHPRLVRSYMYTHTASITRQAPASHGMLLPLYSPCKPASVGGIGKLV